MWPAVTILDRAGRDKCGFRALRVEQGGAGACIEKGVKTAPEWLQVGGGSRRLFTTHFLFPFLPFMTDTGPLARKASPSRCPSPCLQPPSLSRCSPVSPGGRPPRNSSSRAAHHVNAAFYVTQLLAPSPPPCGNLRFPWFPQRRHQGAGQGGARGAEAPFDWWVAKPLLSTDSPPSCPRSAPSVGLAS